MHAIINQISPIASNLELIRNAISENTKLIAVSKKQPFEKIKDALTADQRIFGENYVQEATTRWSDLRTQYNDLQLHLIGPLQTNKVKDAVELFDFIHTLDRKKLAEKLAVECVKQGKKIPCFVQINTAVNVRDNGIEPKDLKDFLGYCQKLGLTICGLMVLPPVIQDAEPHFVMAQELARANNLPELSMGMSNDWEKAVRFGATYIRVGTCIFGTR